MSKTRNIIIFVSIAILLVLVYIFFIKSDAEAPALVSSAPTSTSTLNTNQAVGGVVSGNLSILLNIQSIKLDDSIFADKAFNSLRDSTVPLSHDLTDEGRPNPFAPLGSDTIASPTITDPVASDLSAGIVPPVLEEKKPVN